MGKNYLKNRLKGLILYRAVYIFGCIVGCYCNFTFAADNDVVKVSAHPSYPPIMWLQDDKMVGVAFKVVDYVFKKIGVAHDAIHVGPWKRVHKNAMNGNIDIIAAAYLNDERQSYLLYSEWFMEDPVALFVWHDKQFKYDKWSDLIGKHGTTHLGESYGEKFDQYIKENLTVDREYKYINHFRKLEHGRVDYFLYGLYPGLIEIHKHGYHGKIVKLKKNVVNEKFYITISKKSPYVSLLPQINQEIIKVRNTRLVKQWVDEAMDYYKQHNTP
ncbi:substrate-binding periplasmic protein [Spartinivicinus poritis]|uniref:Transporter substrate-binding domain-containing protein n=1 Tax=Spartinivicinus poritis TaxID=2994640 RepID=A0ABT5UDW3_9GAMM|nr:transporter substrate-binding domain-containing protein [Spartinivicinus sp. A2-2]MDE1464400.1 transporter substrate-binding domain-containing protein [Spartinivicinus sp. A2-2]